ncbi:MAG: hypothetical protein U0610_02955 [bacterium]
MSTSIWIDLADDADDAELRRLLRDNAMPGGISVAFHREPSFFRAVGIEGDAQQVIVGRDAADPARIRGVATRSTRTMWVNGQARRIGYLSGLRVDPAVRQSIWLARGYQKLRELHEADPVPVYVSTIIEDNALARSVLASGRAGLPRYRDLGRLRTFSVHLAGRARGARVPGIAVEPGSAERLGEIVACLARHGATRQFAPRWLAADFAGDSPRVPDLRPEDFRVALRGGRVVGTMARWDQSRFKQTVVVGYGGAMRWLRPLYGLAGRLLGFAPLPKPGLPFHYFHAAFASVDPGEDDPRAVFRLLLSTLFDEARGKDYGFFMLGLHERDPLVGVLDEFRYTPYDARIYAVHWPDGAAFADELDARPPAPEVSTL